MKNLLHYIVRHRRIYLGYTLLGLAIVETAFVLQLIFVLPGFSPSYAVVPTLLGLTIGLLIATAFSLRKDMARQRCLFHAVAELAQEFTYFRRLDGRYDYVSPACFEVTGHSPEAFYAQPHFMDQLILSEDQSRWKDHVHSMSENGHSEALSLRIQHKDGRIRWISHLCSTVEDTTGKVIGVRSTNLDITEQVRAEQQLRDLADYDPLTGLANRRLLMKRLQQMTDENGEGSPFAVLFLDLSRFKHINDSQGHSFGDELLRGVAERLSDHCGERGLVSRFGGDEFVILLPGVAMPPVAEMWTRDLLQALEQPFEVRKQRLFIGGSVGIALYPDDGTSPEELIRNADVAMYRAKREGQGKIGFYNRDLVAQATAYLDMETRLREGLERNEIQLHYQPRIRLTDGQVIGFEALARWYSNDEWISPERFIPVAEETGLIDRMTEQLLMKAAQVARAWPQQRFSFNLSGHQFRRPDLVEWLHGIISSANGNPAQFEFEITEGVLLHAPEDAKAHITALQKLGYRVSLDDFGTGYSSLSYLRDLPFDTVKLDGSFVRGMLDNVKDAAVVRTITALCHDTGMSLVAEGIETEDQREQVMALGTQEGQGYLLARPMDAQALSNWMESNDPSESVAKCLRRT